MISRKQSIYYIPQDDHLQLKSIFINGELFWHGIHSITYGALISLLILPNFHFQMLGFRNVGERPIVPL